MTDRPLATSTVPALAHDPALAEIVRRLIETYRPLRVYLFGSRARSSATADSDYDLMVVVPDDMPVSLKRVFALDVLLCPRGGGRRRIVGVYTGGERLRALLERLGLGDCSAARGPSRSPPRALSSRT